MGVFVGGGGGGGGGLTWTLILRIFGMVSITFFFAPPSIQSKRFVHVLAWMMHISITCTTLDKFLRTCIDLNVISTDFLASTRTRIPIYSTFYTMRKYLFMMVCGSLLSLAIAHSDVAADILRDHEWSNWMQKHMKYYASDNEELERYVTWRTNKAYVEYHNALAQDFGYSLALNTFGDVVGVANV